MLNIKDVSKIYVTKAKESINALQNINLEVGTNGLLFILGQSGSGKTTLLNILGGLDSPTSGGVFVDDLEIGRDISLEKYRQNYVGFVFQEYNLLEHLNVFDNIALAISSCSKDELRKRVSHVLKSVDLAGYEKRRISELSGGQKQRIAIARALAKNSSILLCDEPTGNLDSQTSDEIFKLLEKIAKDKIVIVVSHNDEMAKKYSNRTIKIKDGVILSDEVVSQSSIKVNSVSNTNSISILYRLKLGFENLVSHKFKTSISFILLLLSLLLTCLMQICSTYSPEKAINKSLDDETIYVVKSSSSNNLQTYNFKKLGNEVENILNNDLYRKGYDSMHGTIFISNDDLTEKEFYCKKDLAYGYAYITDYYLNIKINLSNSYTHIDYTNYSEVLDKAVIYDSKEVFKIAGVIKTDYKLNYDERGNLQDDVQKDFNDKAIYNSYIKSKEKYEYDIIYTTKDTFIDLDLGANTKTIRNDDGKISITEAGYTANIDTLILKNKNIYVQYMDNTGVYKNTKLNPLSKNEIVISQDLYDTIFGVNSNWSNFMYEYNMGIENDELYTNQLSHLGKKISVKFYDGKDIEASELIVVGVLSNVSYDDTFIIHCPLNTFGYNNETLIDNVVDEIRYEQIDDKLNLLEELRQNDILVCGAIATSIYDINNILSPMLWFFVAVTIALAIITIISIINLVLAKIKDKEKEIGILMGIGFKTKEISFIYVFSIIFMMLVSFGACIGIIYLFLYTVNNLLQMISGTWIAYFNVDYLTYLSIVCTGIIIVIVSSIPLISLSRKKPIDIIKNQ